MADVLRVDVFFGDGLVVVLDVPGVAVTSCVNGASPIRFVLSLFYLFVFHMNPVCVYI